jgi:3D (Asp-Asp-Asp) domain-containing protein
MMMNCLKNTKLNTKGILSFVILLVGIMLILIVSISACTANDEDNLTEQSVLSGQTESESSDSITEQKPTEPELISLGEYKLTAYCGCTECCGVWGENRPLDCNGNPIVYTANHTVAVEGVTIAADLNVLPYGTKVIIDGHTYIVQDKGGSINGNKIDVYFESHQAALEFGVQYKEIFVEREVENDD